MLSVLQSLKNLGTHFDGKVPPSVTSVAPGLGWAKEPSADHSSPAIDEVYQDSNHSFGTYLSGIIYMALEQSWEKTEDDYVGEVEEFFLNVGIEPKQPHLLRTMTWEQIKLLAINANLKLVAVAPPPKPLAVPTDHTQPFPF